MAQLIGEWVMSCEQCIRNSAVNCSFTRSPLQNPNEHITAPEDAMENDLVPESPPCVGFEKKLTAMDVFSCFSCAYPTSSRDAKTIVKVLIKIITKHAYLSTTFISKKAQPLCLT